MKKFERLTARAQLLQGVLTFDNERWFRGMLSLYDDCKVLVIVERQKRSRSKEQMGYYWGVVLPLISEHTGYTPYELHEILKVKFLKRKRLWRGAELFIPASTSDLSTGEMAEYITQVILEAGEMGIVIPEADKLYSFKDANK